MARFRWGPSPPRRRYRRRWSGGVVLVIVLLILVAWLRGRDLFFPDRELSSLETLQEAAYELVRVVDGDTIIVRPIEDRGRSSIDGQARVRLIGIDAPESVKPDHPVETWGKEAAEFTRDFLDDGPMEVRLDRRRKDRFDRFLAYIYVEEQMLNEALVRAGLARAVHYSGDSRQIAGVLREAEDEARRERRGIWSEE
jgi:micrococcal nuclease